MSLNSLGNKLYLSSLQGGSSFRVEQGNIIQDKFMDTSKKSTMVCSSPQDNNMIYQVPNSNDLVLCDPDLREIKSMKGNYKQGTGKKKFKNPPQNFFPYKILFSLTKLFFSSHKIFFPLQNFFLTQNFFPHKNPP